MEKPTPQRPSILQPSGGYEKLVSYQVAKLLYDVTVRFVDRYIPARAFEKGGGFSERLYKVRTELKRQQAKRAA